MKKIVRLTESDLTRIVKRIIRENEEQQITDEVTNIILNNISKEDLLTLGKLYNSIGEDEFKDVAEDVVDSVIEGDTVSESIGFSRRGITVDTEAEKNKLELTKIITRFATTVLSLMTGAVTINTLNPQHQDIDSAMVAGIITAALVGTNLLTRIPHKIGTKPLPKKLKDSRMAKLVDSELKNFDDPRNTLIQDAIKHLMDKRIPETVARQFIENWEEINNIKFVRPPEKRVKRAK
jgi:hypothetical protein